MNTTDSTTQSNVIDAAHRFRPDLNDPLVAADKLSAQAWEMLREAGYGPENDARWHTTRDALVRDCAPELFELTRAQLLDLLTPAQRAALRKHPWIDVRNIACWNIIRRGSDRDPDGGESLTA